LASRTAERRVAGASATGLLNESLKKRHVTNLAQQGERLTTTGRRLILRVE
jgi:hypothetical protein